MSPIGGGNHSEVRDNAWPEREGDFGFPARHSFPCIPGVDHRSARVIEIVDIARDDDEIMHDRGGRNQPVGLTPRTQAAIRPHSMAIWSVTPRMRSA